MTTLNFFDMRPFLTFILFWIVLVAQAQQTSLVQIYRHNWALLNAAAFPRNYMEDQDLQNHIGLVARNQMIQTEGMPQHYQLRWEHIPDFENDMKLGFFLSHDKAGAWEESKIQGNYAYSFSLSRNEYLSIGATLGFTQQRVNANLVNWQTTPNLPTDLVSNWLVDVNMGIFYNSRPASGGINRYSKKFRTRSTQPNYYVGASITQFISAKLDGQEPDNTFNSGLKPHYYIVAGGVVRGFEPTIWVRYLPGITYLTWGFDNPFSVDFNVRKSIEDVWVGAGISTNGTANAEFGVNLWIGQGSSKVGDQLQLAFALGNMSLHRLAFGGGVNLEVSGSFNF